MRISSSWLGNYVALPPSAELETVFEMAGIGVEDRSDDLWTLEITSNRGDWLSAVGLAREVSAMTGAPVNFAVSREPRRDDNSRSAQFEVEIDDPADCPRYAARLIEGIAVGPSPAWLQQRLIEAGMRPVNNVVDAANYVMLEMGQPLHAFDADKLAGERIVVRRARAGESIVTLDGNRRELGPEVLLITDGDAPIACAGIMGGRDSEVSEGTTRILLESAHFAPLRVRRGTRHLDLSSEASRRFERWVDPNGVARAAERATQLLVECAGATQVGPLVDLYPAPMQDAVVTMRVARCNAILGLHLALETMTDAFRRLGFRILNETQETIRVAVPTWRRDIEREIDLIEEIARIHGYGQIPTTLPQGVNPTAGRSLSQRLEDRAKSALLRSGLSEVVTYSLQSAAAVARAGLPLPQDPADMPLQLVNALSEDFTQLRTSMLPSLLEVLSKNARRRARIFELGRVYCPLGDKAQPDERRTLGLAMLDAQATAHWQGGGDRIDFFALKASIEHLLDGLGAPEGAYREVQAAPFHPGRCACLSIDGEDMGTLGEVHPDIAERYDLAGRAYLATIDLEALVRHVTLARRYVPVSRYPSADRDIALVVHRDVSAAAVQNVLRRSGAPLLEKLDVFDVYSGPQLPAGHKSLNLALRFRAADRTLQDAEVDAVMARLAAAVQNELGGQLRA